MRHKYQHIDLFSGIGGFALSARWVGNIKTVQFCEIEEFPQKVLKKNFPDVPIHSDIFTLNYETIKENGWEQGTKTIITGGFPCQPFSVAGSRSGKSDDRYLWPEMLRIIREISPAWVIAENVLGITSMGQSDNSSYLESKEFGYTKEELVLPEIIKSLESAGYEVLALAIPASGLNAPHRRQRVWIIAKNNSGAGIHRTKTAPRINRKFIESNEIRTTTNTDPINDRKNTIDREFQGTTKEIEGKERNKNGERLRSGSGNGNQDARNPDIKGLEGHREHGERTDKRVIRSANWEKQWPEVVEQLCRVDDGLSGTLDKDRTNRLKGLGNGIMPQIAQMIFQYIQDYDNK